jgi:hypothetical protein
MVDDVQTVFMYHRNYFLGGKIHSDCSSVSDVNLSHKFDIQLNIQVAEDTAQAKMHLKETEVRN